MKLQGLLRPLALAALFAVLAAPAAMAQSTPAGQPDGRWTAWQGCWRLSNETVREDNLPLMLALAQSSASGGPNAVLPGMLVCVTPSGNAGVTMTTFADGKVVLEQTVVADGASHPITDAGCQGSQTSQWSRDGRRLFTTVDVACNDKPAQKVSGITLFGKGTAWLDIQSIDAGGDQHVRVRRYEATSERPAGSSDAPSAVDARARLDAQSANARPLTLDDVVEASGKTASAALEAALVETGSKFKLNSGELTRLADAHVSPNVIDVMVAQSFPLQFRVDRAAQPQWPSGWPQSSSGSPVAGAVIPPPFGNFGYPPYAIAPYNPYDPYYYYYYSPFAYPYYWGTSQYFIRGGGPRFPYSNGSASGGSGQPAQGGQVVNGRGYTRVRPAGSTGGSQATPAQHTNTGGQAVRSTGGSTDASSPTPSSGGSSSSGTSSSGSGGSGGSSSGVSGSGYSNGGSGSDSGRTAKPRQ